MTQGFVTLQVWKRGLFFVVLWILYQPLRAAWWYALIYRQEKKSGDLLSPAVIFSISTGIILLIWDGFVTLMHTPLINVPSYWPSIVLGVYIGCLFLAAPHFLYLLTYLFVPRRPPTKQ
jgi:hypothetical protein